MKITYKLLFLCTITITILSQGIKECLPKKSIMNITELIDFLQNNSSQHKTPNHLSPEQAVNLIIANQDLVILKFYANWCSPCREWAKIMHLIVENYQPIEINGHKLSLTVIEIDIDKYRALANKYGIKSIPTGIYFAHGRETVKRTEGFKNYRDSYNKILELAATYN